MRNSLSHVPGPWYSRWTSAVLTYHWLQGRRAIYVQHLHEKYGKQRKLRYDYMDLIC